MVIGTHTNYGRHRGSVSKKKKKKKRHLRNARIHIYFKSMLRVSSNIEAYNHPGYRLIYEIWEEAEIRQHELV